MKKTIAPLGAVALALAFAVPALAQNPKAAPGKIGTSETVMVKATVEAIDPAARTVTTAISRATRISRSLVRIVPEDSRSPSHRVTSECTWMSLEKERLKAG